MTATVADIAVRALRRLGVAIVPAADRPALTTVIPLATIATQALVWLAVIAADETPAPLDQALALAKVTAIHDSLVAQGIVSWTSAAIPQAVSEEYIALTAMHLAPSFGKPADLAKVEAMEARIRRVTTIMRAPEVAEAAVMSAHADLTARGWARWTVFDIPDEIANAYVALAAQGMAGEFSAKPDPSQAPMAMIAIARYIALPTSGVRIVGEYF